MYTIENLSDPISKHFRHPIGSVLNSQGVKTISEMVSLNLSIHDIRCFGKKSFEKYNFFKELVTPSK
jgi:hypothetical protein